MGSTTRRVTSRDGAAGVGDLVLDAFNRLGREDNDIAYYYASRLSGEPLDGIEDVHFHPMVKPSARVTMVWKF